MELPQKLKIELAYSLEQSHSWVNMRKEMKTGHQKMYACPFIAALCTNTWGDEETDKKRTKQTGRKNKTEHQNDRNRERFWRQLCRISQMGSIRWNLAPRHDWEPCRKELRVERQYAVVRRFLLSRGRWENQRNASCCYSWKGLMAMGTFAEKLKGRV